jgi:hypothetical protein
MEIIDNSLQMTTLAVHPFEWPVLAMLLRIDWQQNAFF